MSVRNCQSRVTVTSENVLALLRDAKLREYIYENLTCYCLKDVRFSFHDIQLHTRIKPLFIHLTGVFLLRLIILKIKCTFKILEF